ncbi:hypothetical protein D9613_010382 [Agrocybe pediades]|uniref:Uncharacterized protein n=1 Tax=Agrocybe pediades TaxID=84607 RepID=A0A8H4QGB0_9AGAR|nr:hypothetical protein D9613_010382 [Agrocybe pediades]
MADPLSTTLAAITFGTALKDVIELAVKLHESFKKHAHNMRAAESLAEDTLKILQDIENFYIARGATLDDLPDVRDAVARLSRDMRYVYEQCLPILQLGNSPERGLRRTLFKIEQWRSRKVESDIRNLREEANKCYRRFTRHTQLGTAVAIGELKCAVSEGFSGITRQLSALQVSDENVLAFMGFARTVLSTLPPGVMLSEDLVFKLCVRAEEPDDHHIQPFNIQFSFLFRTSKAVDYVRGNAVTELIRVQQGLLNIGAGGNPIQEGAWALYNLSIDLQQLEMYSESLILSTWTVDLYKTLSKSHWDVYVPHLALAFFNLAMSSYRTGDFAQAVATTTECLSLLKTCASTFETESLTARVLSQSALLRRAIGEHPSASLQDAEDSVAMFERLGADQMAVIGPQQGGNYAIFVLQLTGGDRAVLDYAYALAAQREAVQIWEEVNEITRADEELILDSLATQTKILVEMGRPSDAIMVFQKLAKRVRSMATNQRMYIHELQDLASIFFNKNYYTEAVMATRTLVEICRQSVDSLPTSQRFLINILLDHIEHCRYAIYLSQALIYSQEALAIAGQQRVKDAALTDEYLDCLGWAAYSSIEAGYPQQAINQIQGALNIGPAIQRHSVRCDSEILYLISRKALAFLRLGRLSLAAATITEGYNFSESTTLILQEEAYYGLLLHVSALVHRCGGKQDDALTTIKAAIPIFEFCDWDQRLYTLSDVQADMDYDAEALRTAEEAVQLTADCASSSSPLDNYIYKMSQYSLCLRLFFNGDFTRARRIIVEVRAFYEWHAHSRNAWFINLARALRAEGILECASDRHAEGAAARTRLNELQQRLRATLPGVADQVDMDLNYERSYSAWKRLLEKHPLTCSHWVEEEAITGQEYTI